jgi:hypothetical protein
MKDAFGETINVGDRIAYGVRDSCVVHMRKGTVRKIVNSTQVRWDGSEVTEQVLKVDAEANDYGHRSSYSVTLRTPRAIVKLDGGK